MPSVAKKWKCPPETKKILRQVEKLILEEPRRFDMGTFGSYVGDVGTNFVLTRASLYSSDTEVEIEAPACGTVACIAGWTLIATMPCLNTMFKTSQLRPRLSEHIPWNASKVATRRLGISLRQANRLFYLPNQAGLRSGWPKEFADRHAEAKTQRGRVKVAVERIEHFIKTGE